MPSPGERKGVKFPFQRGEDSFPQWSHGFSSVVDDLRSLLFMGLGEMPMVNDVGTSINQYIFEQPTAIIQALVAREIRGIIAVNFPEMQVLNVLTSVENAGHAQIIVARIIYSISGQEGEEVIPLNI